MGSFEGHETRHTFRGKKKRSGHEEESRPTMCDGTFIDTNSQELGNGNRPPPSCIPNAKTQKKL